MGLGGGGPHAHQRRLAERAEVGRRLLHLGLGAAAELAGGDPERRGAGKDNGKDDGTFHKGALVWVCGVAMLMVPYAAARGFVDRTRVVQGKRVSVRVDPGGRRITTHKTPPPPPPPPPP